ncbi:MAG: formyltransferase [Thermoanaerobaculia bacterium]
MTRIAAFAYSQTGHACLERLLDRGEDVVLVATHADRPVEAAWFPSVAALSRSRGVRTVLMDDPGTDDAVALVRDAAPDLILSFYFRGMLPEATLAIPARGAYNVHGSLLPKYRGRAPVNWAVLRGETETGATLHRMSRRADAGEIVGQQAVPIGPDDTAFEVQSRVTEAALRLLDRHLDALKNGTAALRPQEEAEATTFGRRRPENGRIDWSAGAREVHNLVRALTHPYPGAFTDVFGGKTFLWKTRVPGLGSHDNFPGQVRQESGSLYVACGDDFYLEVLRLQPEGGEEMDGARYAAQVAAP